MKLPEGHGLAERQIPSPQAVLPYSTHVMGKDCKVTQHAKLQ